MRNTMMAAVGLAFFCGAACSSSSGDDSSTSTGAAAGSTGGNSTGAGTGSTSGGATTGTTTGSSLLADGAACSADDLCQSGICGLNGSGNCCTTRCKTDDATCAASACDNTGACTYPAAGGPCNGSCIYGQFTQSLCDGNGACSPQAPVACPNDLTCNAAGTACAGSCDPTHGAADCSTGWYCTSAGTCAPQVQLGACTSNAECESNVCGVNGSGHCCTQTACTNLWSATNLCGTQDCDGATGACTFPSISTSCDTGPIACADSHTQSDPNTFCDGTGDCVPPVLTDCTPYACELNSASGGSDGCLTSCQTSADCAKDFWCSGNACIPQQAIGPCSTNDACLSGQCGANGSGNCCYSKCAFQDPSCNISDCDPGSGVCEYPGSSQACGSVLESCANGVQQNPSVCDGFGNCPAPGITPCSPFACGAQACNTSCADDSECSPGSTCAVAAAVCCPALLPGGNLAVDSQTGSDSAPCCGQKGYTACQTLGFAMSLIDAAQATGVTINATVNGGGGDWSFQSSSPYNYSYHTGDNVPVTLGWGVELDAPGVNFAPDWFNLGYGCDSSYNNCFSLSPQIFDIKAYSANDTSATASIVGDQTNGVVQVGVGLNGGFDTFYLAAIHVESGAHLYISNANVSASYDPYYFPYHTASFIVEPGGHLTFGQDQSAGNTGPVIAGGTQQNNSSYWGYVGLVCNSDGVSQGCTVDDYGSPAKGTSSVTFQNNYYRDIEADDFASITLTGNPIIGDPPSATGFRNCSSKVDGEGYGSSNGAMIWLNGAVTMSFSNGTVQCLSGTAFSLNSSPNGNGNPSLTLTDTTIQNVDTAVYASAGSASVSNTTIEYTYRGVIQDTDGTNEGSIDLSGGGNTVACANGLEGAYNPPSNYYNCTNYGYDCVDPAAAVIDLTASNLDAENVAWDTQGPDLFSCTDASLTSCTCQNSSCAVAAGSDGMDAVYDSSGTVDTANASVSTLTCESLSACGYYTVCTGTQSCCYPYGTGYPYYTYCITPGGFCD